MKKITSTILASLCTGGLALTSIPVNAEVNPQGQSILCQQQGWLTQIAISTPDFVTAISSQNKRRKIAEISLDNENQ